MNIVVYCGSSFGTDPAYAEAAKRLGAWIGSSRNRMVYGGSSVGLMGLASSACLRAGGEVEGVEPGFFIEQGVAQHDLTRLHVVETMSERKALMIELGDAFVALPGGIGTLEEISEVMTRVHLGLGPAQRCYLLNVNGYYEPLRALLATMAEKGFLPAAQQAGFCFCDSVDELIAELEG